MKIKNVTKFCKDVVQIIKTTSPEGTEVKIYDANSIRFIHSFNKESQMLSISNLSGSVQQPDWIFGVTNIMKMNLEDVIIQSRKSGVTIVMEKPEHLPKVANCTF